MKYLTLLLSLIIFTGCGVLSNDSEPLLADTYAIIGIDKDVEITYKTNNGEETFNTNVFWEESDDPFFRQVIKVESVKNPYIKATNKSDMTLSFSLSIRNSESEKALSSVGVILKPNESFVAEEGVFAQKR